MKNKMIPLADAEMAVGQLATELIELAWHCKKTSPRIARQLEYAMGALDQLEPDSLLFDSVRDLIVDRLSSHLPDDGGNQKVWENAVFSYFKHLPKKHPLVLAVLKCI